MAQDTKELIYQAAVSLFYEKGFNGTSLRDICAASGSQVSSVYHHYKNKQGLLYAVLDRATDDSTQLLRSRLNGVVGAEERLNAAIAAHVEWHTSRQREAYIADAELPRLEPPYAEKVRERRSRHEQIINEIIQAGVDSGEFRETHVPVLTRMLLTGATGVASWYRPHGDHDARGIAAVFSDALIQGLRSPHAGSHTVSGGVAPAGRVPSS